LPISKQFPTFALYSKFKIQNSKFKIVKIMARIRHAVMGEFIGKLGNVVGAHWNGINTLCAYSGKVKNPDTDPQRQQRKKFSVAGKFVKPLQPVLRIGWKKAAHGMTPVNAAMRHILRNTITGVYPDFTVDAEKVMISSGSLLKPMGAKATKAGDNITITWTDNSVTDPALETDAALVALHNPALGEAVCLTEAARRADATASVQIPEHWQDGDYSLYLGFVTKDGKHASDSVHIPLT
jgi:hypothetical protein